MREKGDFMLSYDMTLDVAAIIIYVVLIILYLSKPHIKDRTHKIYLQLFTVALTAPFMDIFGDFAIDYHWGKAAVYVLNTFFYLTLEGITYHFFVYLIGQIQTYRNVTLFQRLLTTAPIFLMAAVIVSNPWTHLIFSYDESRPIGRQYLTEPFQLLTYAISVIYFAFSIIFLIRNRRVLDRRFTFTVYFICAINLISILCQFIFYFTMIVNFGFALSMVLLYMTRHTKNSAINPDTGLLNREFLYSEVSKMVTKSQGFSVILIKITDYELLTEVYDTRLIQKLLLTVEKNIAGFVPVGDGYQASTNCFALVLSDKGKAEELQGEIVKSLRNAWVVEGRELSFAVLVTIVNCPEKITSVAGFSSCLQTFEKIKSRFGILPPSELYLQNQQRQLEVEKAVRRGLENHGFEVYYQPMCTARDRKFVTAEALVRLNDSELGSISPEEFIPVAEKSGLMVQLGNFILEEVCAFIARNDMEALGLEYIEVNLSVVQCLQHDFKGFVSSLIEKYGIQKKYLCFEITETASNCSPHVFTENLNYLVDEGFILALDDFGTGYANVKRLIETKFRIIKIDYIITQSSFKSQNRLNAFRQQVGVFHSLGFEVISEGVETEEQYSILKDIGVDYIQGFVLSHAIPEKDFIAFLKSHLQ